jgi:hypothetical protein
MLIECLEGRRLLSASAIAGQAQAGGVGDLAQTTPGAAAAVAKPADVGPTSSRLAAPSTPSQANPVAGQTDTIADTAQSSPGAVAGIAHPA